MKKNLLYFWLLCQCRHLLVLKNPLNIKAVDEYVPAPGQFINTLPELSEKDTPETAAQACTKYLANQKQSGLITLGAYGGYITFHFDHPIINVENAPDFVVYGNSFPGWSEPGIVMVMKDETATENQTTHGMNYLEVPM